MYISGYREFYDSHFFISPVFSTYLTVLRNYKFLERRKKYGKSINSR